MNREQALQTFWSSFGIPAYDENSVPDNAPFPYLTYESIVGVFGESVSNNVSLWYKSTDWVEITEKKYQIESLIPSSGKVITIDNNTMWFRQGSPFARRSADNVDNTIKRIILNIETEFLMGD